MLIVFGVLIIIACIILGAIVLIQNPKGGGLSSTFGGFSNQLMGVKQTTDVLEKGTWIFAGIVAVLCMVSPIFIPKGGSDNQLINNMSPNIPAAQKPVIPSASGNAAPATTAPMPGATVPAAKPIKPAAPKP